MPYTTTPTAIPEVLILEPKVFGDSRGFFFESFNEQDFAQATGLNPRVRQLNVQAIDLFRGDLKNVYYKRDICCG
jgi:dTDP-4-dehydrorhamnose 3,5-epimerase